MSLYTKPASNIKALAIRESEFQYQYKIKARKENYSMRGYDQRGKETYS
jgi:hypothetical protein